MNKSTLVPREEMSDLDWLARNVNVWPLITPKVISAGDELFEFGANFYDNCVDIYGKFAGCGLTVTKDQWLSRRAELQSKPSWSDLPDWAMWISQDSDGNWWMYETEPKSILDVRGTSHWSCSDGSCESLLRFSGEVIGDYMDTLEKRPEQAEFEPFVSVEDAATTKHATITKSKYTKTIHGVSVDVYDVLQAWGVSNPALQHLIKKALQCGQRGHKDNAQDLQDIIDSAVRAKELEC